MIGSEHQIVHFCILIMTLLTANYFIQAINDMG